MKISNYSPVEHDNYDKSVHIEFNADIEEFSASILLTNLIEWLNIFGKKDIMEEVIEWLYKKFSNITFNTVEIDIEAENEYFKGVPQYSHSPISPDTVLLAPQQGQAITLVCTAAGAAPPVG